MKNRLLAALCFVVLSIPALAHGEARPNSPAQEQTRESSDRPNIEVAFVLDTTGSMGGLIEGAKEKIWSIASQIARGKPSPRLKVALVAYRDIGDEYVTKRFDLTNDLDSVFVHLKAFQAAGGGDEPEHVGRGLGEAVSKLSWSESPNTLKMIFLVGDAPPHIYNDGWNYRDWAQRAVEKNIVVNTVRCGNSRSTEIAWREIARPSHGSFMSIDESGGMVAMSTPYDAKMAKLNAEIASKTIYAGSAMAQTESKRQARMIEAMEPAAAADRAAFTRHAGMMSAAPAATAGAKAMNSTDDFDHVAPSDVPEELKGLDAPKQKAKVAELANERSVLESELSKVSAERDSWMKDNAPKKADSFDAKVTEVLKAKAERIGVAY